MKLLLQCPSVCHCGATAERRRAHLSPRAATRHIPSHRTSAPFRTGLACSPSRQHAPLNAVRQHVGGLTINDSKFAVVVARFNDLVTKLLMEGAVEGLKRHGANEDDIEVVWVPGSFELPVVAKSIAKSGKFGAVICIGTVVRGATTHYEAVVSGATSGVLNASVDSGVPIIFGVLTCDTMEQALDRAGGKVGNKGYEAAVTAVEMANLLKSLRSHSLAAEPW